jgi:hypothetical protein
MESPPLIDQDPAEPDEDTASVVTRVGTVVGAGVIAALVASLPAMIRLGGAGSFGASLQQWAVLGALITPLGILGVGVLRRARVGMRMLAGPHLTVVWAALVWWCVLELGLLSVFGAVLRAKTHHHGLAGVTFAFFAVASGLVVALLAVRGARFLARFGVTAQRIALGLALAAAAAAVVLIGVRTSRSPDLPTARVLVDVLVLTGLSALGSARSIARLRLLALIGVPLAAIVLVLGLSTVRSRPPLAEAIGARAPLHALLLSTVGSS